MSCSENMACLTVREAITRLFILRELSKKEMHGYELLKTLRKKGRLGGFSGKVSAGKLYSFLGSLAGSGYMRSEWKMEGGRHRKVLSITPCGRKMLRESKAYIRSAFREMRRWMPEVFE